MQSTGQESTQAESLVPMQGSAITYAIKSGAPWSVRRIKLTFYFSRKPGEAKPLAAKGNHDHPVDDFCNQKVFRRGSRFAFRWADIRRCIRRRHSQPRGAP